MINASDILTSKDKFKIKLGLDRVKLMLKLFCNPQNSVRAFHIAGTNGKGSVCSVIESILLKDKRKIIGKYTSPHLFSYTERFCVNGVNISDEELNEIINLINKKDEEYKIGLSEFEILTVACFLFFKRHNVEIAIIETGLGGRLDATNVIEDPIASVITSISFDHKERLGDTIEKIAFEKAGIIKENSNVVFLPQNKGYSVLKKTADKKHAKIVKDDIEIELEDNIAKINGEECRFSLSGDYQKENLKLALLAIKCLPYKISFETIKKALCDVKWKFRTENINYKGHNLLIDACHNPDGARVLDEYIKKYKKDKKIKFIYGTLKNKDYGAILDKLYDKSYNFCFYEFNYPNALKYDELKEYKNKLRKINNPLDEILKGDYELCIISGSIYMLGQIFKGVL